MYCPNCKSRIESDELFCQGCGLNLKIDKTIKEHQNISVKPMSMEKPTINQYNELEEKIEQLKNVPDELKEQENYYTNLMDRKKYSESRLNEIAQKRKVEFEDVQRLKGVTLTSIFATIRGDKQQKIEKEEVEYFDVLNREEAAQKEVADLESVIKQTLDQIDKLRDLDHTHKQILHQHDELIRIVCEGVIDPIEDKIEEELKEIEEKYQPLKSKEVSLVKTHSHLTQAINHLQQAYNELGGASNMATWDTFFGGGLLVDSIKHSRMSTARNAVQRAEFSINSAKQELPELGYVASANVENISFFWDGFMDNIFSDFSARDKIHRSRDSVDRMLNDTHETLNWVKSKKSENSKELLQLDTIRNEKIKELKNERMRMIKDYISIKR